MKVRIKLCNAEGDARISTTLCQWLVFDHCRDVCAQNGQVVPFSPAAGLLEWVEETVPLSEYLNGPDRASGAHARYARPGDLTYPAAQARRIWRCTWPGGLRRPTQVPHAQSGPFGSHPRC